MFGTTEVKTESGAAHDIKARVAGVGAIAFAAIVVLQNIVRGGSAPANDASNSKVLEYYTDHRAVTAAMAVTFVLGGLALAVFAGGAMRRFLAGDRPGWAFTGFVGAAGVMLLFAVVAAADQAMSVVANGNQPNADIVGGLWALHNSIFTVLFLFIGVALLGLSRAGVAAGITPPVFERLGPVGCALLAVASMAGPFIAGGDAMPLFALGGIGFVIWLAFLVTTGARLMGEQS